MDKENWDNLTWKQILKRLDWKLFALALVLSVGIVLTLNTCAEKLS